MVGIEILFQDLSRGSIGGRGKAFRHFDII
jgi:hypothetical protein